MLCSYKKNIKNGSVFLKNEKALHQKKKEKKKYIKINKYKYRINI